MEGSVSMIHGGGLNGYYEPYWTQNELEHFGIKGMKWGIRRYQNSDGTLTEAGKKRYGSKENFDAAQEKKRIRNQKIAKAAKTTAKVTAAIGLGVLSTRMMGVAMSNIVNSGGADARLTKALLNSYGKKTISDMTYADELIWKWQAINRTIDNMNYENRRKI